MERVGFHPQLSQLHESVCNVNVLADYIWEHRAYGLRLIRPHYYYYIWLASCCHINEGFDKGGKGILSMREYYINVIEITATKRHESGHTMYRNWMNRKRYQDFANELNALNVMS